MIVGESRDICFVESTSVTGTVTVESTFFIIVVDSSFIIVVGVIFTKDVGDSMHCYSSWRFFHYSGRRSIHNSSKRNIYNCCWRRNIHNSCSKYFYNCSMASITISSQFVPFKLYPSLQFMLL